MQSCWENFYWLLAIIQQQNKKKKKNLEIKIQSHRSSGIHRKICKNIKLIFKPINLILFIVIDDHKYCDSRRSFVGFFLFTFAYFYLVKRQIVFLDFINTEQKSKQNPTTTTKRQIIHQFIINLIIKPVYESILPHPKLWLYSLAVL